VIQQFVLIQRIIVLNILKVKKAIVPICNRVIPIIEDEYVDLEFGTGCLKVTPAHDENDKVLGDKHTLEVIDIFNEDASLNSFGLHYEGKDRFVVRKEVTKELEEIGFLVKIEVHTNKVGTSERTKAVIEPRLSDQWFLKMEDLVKPAIKAVLGDDPSINLYPKKLKIPTDIGWKIFVIGIFLDSCGGVNKFLPIFMEMVKMIL